MATLQQIADRLGVSAATVSRVVNNRPGISKRTRLAVLAEMNQLGYDTKTPGIVGQHVALIDTSLAAEGRLRGYAGDLAAGAYRALASHHRDLLVTDVSEKRDQETYAQFFGRKGIGGVILRVSTDTRGVIDAIAGERLPCVVVSDRVDRPDVEFVDFDSRAGFDRAMDYLAHLKHQRIALVIEGHTADTDHTDRFEAYFEGLKRHGLQRYESMIVPVASTFRGGASAIDQLMAMSQPPTAVIFTNPPTTVGGLQRAQAMGLRVPSDLSIVGFDNGNLRHATYPRYTAVCQDAEQIGLIAGHAIVARMADTHAKLVRSVMPTIFEINDTTGPASDSMS